MYLNNVKCRQFGGPKDSSSICNSDTG